MKKKKNRVKKNLWLRIREYVNKNYAKAIFFVIGIFITVLITKTCDRIIPNPPVIVEKIPDSINVVHVYEPLSDSVWTTINRNNTENTVNAVVAKQTISNTNQNILNNGIVNKVMKSASFPKAKGYTAKSATPYFSIEMTDLNKSFVDFTFNFFNEDILSDIYCLSIKVFRNKGKEKVYILDENYEKNNKGNTIRLNNIFTSGSFEIEIGFVFISDVNNEYPNFYREVKFINN